VHTAVRKGLKLSHTFSLYCNTLAFDIVSCSSLSGFLLSFSSTSDVIAADVWHVTSNDGNQKLTVCETDFTP